MDERVPGGWTAAEQEEIWARWRRGEALRTIARHFGTDMAYVRRVLAHTGGRRLPPGQRAAGQLSAAEREEVSRGLAAGASCRAIAAHLGRSHTTVSREVARNGGVAHYRAGDADAAAWRRAKRPKPRRLARRPALRAVVEAKLGARWSPEQIAHWRPRAYPDDPSMRVSHETIYLSLFVQARGALKRELTKQLRTGRAMRFPRGARTRRGQGRGQLVDTVSIRDRPAEVEDRAVPGHWEGDLVYGRHHSAVGTLVERTSRYVLLYPLPAGYKGGPAREAAPTASRAAAITRLPEQLRRSLTCVRSGQREGAERARPVHGRLGRAGLHLRPAQSVAARHEREHERAAPAVPAEKRRPPRVRADRPRRDRRGAQRAPARDPGLAEPRRALRRAGRGRVAPNAAGPYALHQAGGAATR
ncbi:hypothetical protein tb265_45700 [Gemmatimonadetes bacterium T265]|nr:hypothetical protein tb265_45700 [Gemmatimonadetes bacterium T265]